MIISEKSGGVYFKKMIFPSMKIKEYFQNKSLRKELLKRRKENGIAPEEPHTPTCCSRSDLYTTISNCVRSVKFRLLFVVVN